MTDTKVNFAAGDLGDLGAQGFLEYKEYDGDQNTNLKRGYFTLINYLSSRAGSFVRLNRRVTNINWSSSKIGLTIESNALHTDRAFLADYVISTVPLGVLKERVGTMFTPPLPTDKFRAIKNLGFGTVDKIFLVFPSNIFTNGESGFQVFWTEDLAFLSTKYGLNRNKFYQAFTEFFVFPKNPNMMLSFLTGEEAAFAETLSDETLLNLIYDILITAFPNRNLPKPTQIIRY